MEEKVDLRSELQVFKSDTRADLFILRDKVDLLVREFNNFDKRFENNEKDIQGVADSLRDKMAAVHQELSDDIIERTKRSNSALLQWIMLIMTALISGVIGHVVGK